MINIGGRLRRLAGPLAMMIVGTAGGCGTTTVNADSGHSRVCSVPTVPVGGVTGLAGGAPGGGGLRVVEQGFSQLDPNQRTVSLGAVLENTSALVAYRARVTFSYADASGQSAVMANSPELSLEIPVILPGQRVPVGTWSYVRKGTHSAAVPIADLRVLLGGLVWLPRDPWFAELSVRPQAIHRLAGDSSSGTVTYSVNSRFCRALTSRGVAMVFRNSAGAIVGGSIDLGSAHQTCAPGTSVSHALVTQSLPADVDESKTEIYPYCDLAPAAAGARDAPIN